MESTLVLIYHHLVVYTNSLESQQQYMLRQNQLRTFHNSMRASQATHYIQNSFIAIEKAGYPFFTSDEG